MSQSPADAVRRKVIAAAKTLVVKVGTSVLSRDDDTLDSERFDSLASQLHAIKQSGRQVVLVSSGAIGAGIGLLGLPGRPTDLPHLQAAAATGQANLIRRYDDALQRFGYRAAQLLLTANDFKNRARYLNVRNTLRTLFEYNTIPIVNENDTVSVDEIRFGDNDRLAALLSHLLDRPLVVILSVVDGLYDGDPRSPGSQRIPVVNEWNDSLRGLAANVQSKRGTGGMQAKLESVRIATSVGESVIIASGLQPDVLPRILAGDDVGTLFVGHGDTMPAWKRWIGYSGPVQGQLVLDPGAVNAITAKQRSLLAIGVRAVLGDFRKGQVVAMIDPQGQEIARGLTNYNSDDTRRILGLRTEQFVDVLGSCPYAEVVHRDNLVATAGATGAGGAAGTTGSVEPA